MGLEQSLAPPADLVRGRRAHPLARYAAARLGISVLLMWGITVVTFILTNLVPADPLAAVLGDQAAADPVIVAQYRKQMGLNDPLPLQYWHYLLRLLHGNLGTSAQTRNPVAQDLATAFPATAELACFVLVASVLLGVGLGLYAALRHRRLADQVIRLVSVTGISMPTALAACQIVAPSGAVTSRPSIVSVTVPVDSGAVIAITAVSARCRDYAK